jgi:hypothetical protein
MIGYLVNPKVGAWSYNQYADAFKHTHLGWLNGGQKKASR